MSTNNKSGRSRNSSSPPGVWNRGRGGGPSNPIRIRTKRLDEIDGDKIALAYWLLAKQIVANGTGEQITEAEVRRVAATLNDDAPATTPQRPREKRGGAE